MGRRGRKGKMNDKELIRKRDQDAAVLGEGCWRSKITNEWCKTDVTFYPAKKLWITEDGKRREITLSDLKKNYQELRV